MRIRWLTLSAAVMVAVGAAGCTNVSEGSPRPASGPATSESDGSPTTDTSESGQVELPYAGAPAVTDPLDTETFQQDPCQALAEDQANALNVQTPGVLRDGGVGKACEKLGKSDRRALVEIASLDKNPYGVSAVYQAEKDGKLAFMDPLDSIEGYPAAAYGALDQREDGECSVVIGTSDEIAFEIVLRLSAKNVGKKDPCETAAVVAGMVLQTMKAAQ